MGLAGSTTRALRWKPETQSKVNTHSQSDHPRPYKVPQKLNLKMGIIGTKWTKWPANGNILSAEQCQVAKAWRCLNLFDIQVCSALRNKHVRVNTTDRGECHTVSSEETNTNGKYAPVKEGPQAFDLICRKHVLHHLSNYFSPKLLSNQETFSFNQRSDKLFELIERIEIYRLP